MALKYLFNTPESLAASVAGELVAPLANKNAIVAEYKNANAKQIQAAYEYEQAIVDAYVEIDIVLPRTPSPRPSPGGRGSKIPLTVLGG